MQTVFFIEDSLGLPFEEREIAAMDNAAAVFLSGERIGGGIILRNEDTQEQVLIEDRLEQVLHRLCVDGGTQIRRGQGFRYDYAASIEAQDFTVADGVASVERDTFFPITAPIEDFAESLFACAARAAVFLREVAKLNPNYADNATNLEQRVAETRAAKP